MIKNKNPITIPIPSFSKIKAKPLLKNRLPEKVVESIITGTVNKTANVLIIIDNKSTSIPNCGEIVIKTILVKSIGIKVPIKTPNLYILNANFTPIMPTIKEIGKEPNSRLTSKLVGATGALTGVELAINISVTILYKIPPTKYPNINPLIPIKILKILYPQKHCSKPIAVITQPIIIIVA